MSDTSNRLLLAQVDVSIRRLEKTMQKAGIAVDRASGKMEKRWEKNNRRMSKSSEDMARNVRAALAGLSFAVAGRSLAQYADKWVDLNNKIKAAGQVAGREGRGLLSLAEGARDARADITQYADLYSRILRSSADLADSEEEVARITNLTAKAFAAGGASAQEQAAGILQLGQALGSGFLQGDELRSIRENAPLVAKAIADSVGASIGQLKALGAEGKLTSQVVFDALLQGGDDIEAAFAVTVPRATDATRLAMDNLSLKLGEYAEQTGIVRGASEGTAAAINFLAENVDTFADVLVIATAAAAGYFGTIGGAAALTAIRGFVGGIVAANAIAGTSVVTMGTLTLAVRTFIASLGPIGIAATIISSAAAAFTYLAVSAESTQKPFDAVEEKLASIRAEMDAVDDLLGAPFDEMGQLAGEVGKQLDPLPEKYRKIRAEMEKNGAAAKQLAVDNAAARVIELRAAAGSTRAALSANEGTLASGVGGRRRKQTIERNKALRKELAEIEADIARAEAQRDGLLKVDRSEFVEKQEKSKPTATSKATGTDRSNRDRDRILEQIESLGRTERDQIALTLAQRLEAIDKSGRAEAEKAELRAIANEDARREIAELDQADQDRAVALKQGAKEIRAERALNAAEELALLTEIEAATARMHGRAMQATQLEIDAERIRLEAVLNGIDEEAKARAEVDMARLREREQRNQRDALAEVDGLTGQPNENTLQGQLERITLEEEARIALLETYRGSEIEALRNFEEIKTQIEAEADQERRDLRLRTLDTQLGSIEAFARNSVQSLRDAGAEGTKAMRVAAKAQQGIALGRATVSAIGAAVQSFQNAGGFPFGLGAAALSLAFTTPQIAALAAQTFAAGGFVRGPGTGTSDSIPARLSNGEFVTRESVTRRNRTGLERLNAGATAEAAFGLPRSSSLSSPIAPGQFAASPVVSVGAPTLTINGSVTSDMVPVLEARLAQMERNLKGTVNQAIVDRERRVTPRHQRSVGVR